MTRAVNKLMNNANEYLCSVVVFLDVSKAFNRVRHQGLIYKPIESPLLPSPIHLLKSNVSSRFFHISIKGENSILHQVQAGVSQGSVLGPVLYLIYTTINSNIYDKGQYI